MITQICMKISNKDDPEKPTRITSHKIELDFLKEIDSFWRSRDFQSRSEFIRYCIRFYLDFDKHVRSAL